MTRWASNTGATIVGSLNIDTIAWTTGNTVRYTFSGSPSLSGVIVGHMLTVTGATNALHNGTFEITAVSDASDYIDVTNSAISDASNNESSSPGTGTAVSDASIVQEPTAAKQAMGWLNGEKPPAGYFNWLFSNSGRVQLQKVNVGYSTISSSTPTALGGEGRDVLPTKTAAFSQTFTAGTTSLGDITDSAISYTATATNRVLVGYSLQARHNDVVDNTLEIRFNIDGSNLATAYAMGYAGPVESLSAHYLITSVSAGVRTAKLQTQTSAGNALTISSGVFWGVEFAAAAAAATLSQDTVRSITSTSYADVPTASLEVAVSPTNNPLLILCTAECQESSFGGGDYATYKLTDGTNNYGEWPNAYDASSEKSHTMAWVTGDLNGAQTIKLQAKVTANSSGLRNRLLSAIEITGDSKRAIPAGTCTISSSDATVTDGSTALSHSFTPGSDINYLAIFTGYLERTAGTGYITLKIKSGATALLSIENKLCSGATNIIPFTLMVPTGLLTSGVAAALTATALTSDGGTTFTIKSAGFFLVEAPALTDAYAGDPASLTFTDVKAGPIEVNYRSVRDCSADDDLTLGLYANVNSGGFALIADSVQTIATPGTDPQALHYYHMTDSYAEGDDVVLELRADIDTGSVIFEEGILTGKEVPSL